MKRRGLRGQPWYTPTSWRTGSVAPSTATLHMSCCGSDPNAFRRSYQTCVVATKLCSWQPLNARNPFCAMGSRWFCSIQRDSRRASSPL
eukprot:jgi/Phyca11/123608/e_gw1.51.344.1